MKDDSAQLFGDRVYARIVVRVPTPAPAPTPVIVPTPTWVTIVVPPTPMPEPRIIAEPRSCCKICRKGKACGNSCISRSYTCHQPPGCACDG